MKKNYTVMFIMLFTASITGGMAAKDLFKYSPIAGWGMGMLFLLCAAYFAGKNEKKSGSQ
ncbi:hypothetical protein [Metabacillus indicus]|uniref:hypothetical protein n=1 Tax=Metabacillus indicus TaxID=246786 RepID=UPI0004939B5F|nr:hypothetical protein [Metabacillus indicus]KEZ49242.1 hypothetical protein AZ46_0214345 [Metabacillus indicus LMG 22858]